MLCDEICKLWGCDAGVCSMDFYTSTASLRYLLILISELKVDFKSSIPEGPAYLRCKPKQKSKLLR